MELCALWTADTRDEEGRPTRDEGSITYTAAIERAETRATDRALAPFAQRVEREAQRRWFDEASRRVAIGDGAPWLWNIVAECFPGTLEILDKFHAQEHVHDVAGALFGVGTDLGRAWSKLRCDGWTRAGCAHSGRVRARRPLRGGQKVRRLLHAQPPPDGLPDVRVAGPVRRQRRLSSAGST